jgi:hypothetical protein
VPSRSGVKIVGPKVATLPPPSPSATQL